MANYCQARSQADATSAAQEGGGRAKLSQVQGKWIKHFFLETGELLVRNLVCTNDCSKGALSP